MQSALFDSAKESVTSALTYSGTHYQRATKRELFAVLKSYFSVVVQAYVTIRQYPVLACVDVNEDAPNRSRTWTTRYAHYLCDIELSTERALGGDLDLQAAWFKLALGQPVPPAIAHIVIGKCARAYKAKKLDPGRYLKPTRQR